MFYYVYVLKSSREKDRFYTGYTKDLKKRLIEHNQGRDRATKGYTPWVLIYYEACRDARDARRREKYLKTTQGHRLLKRRLKEYLVGNSTTG